MGTLIQDFRYAVRVLARSRSFTIAALLTLAVGIGATTAIFSVLYAVVLEPLPYRDPSRLVIIRETDPHNDSYRENASIPDLRDWQEQSHSFQSLTGFSHGTATLTDPPREAERVDSAPVFWDLFATLGVQPILGRSFTQKDDVKNAAPVVIISFDLWQKRYGGRAILDRQITIDGKPHRVIGVMPRSFDFPNRPGVWLPLIGEASEFALLRGNHGVAVIGRLKTASTVDSASREMTSVMAGIAARESEAAGRGIRIETLQEAVVGDVRPRLILLSVAVSIVLLIGCINVAALMLARAGDRSRELAIRASLGASRGRIVRQVFIESLVLALTGAGLGVALGGVATKLMVTMLPSLPRAGTVGLRMPVLAFAILTALVAAIASGLVPAIRAGRTGFSNLRGRAHMQQRSIARSVLVVVEVALAVVLVIGAGLFLQSLRRLLAVDTGMRTEHVLTAALELPSSTYPVPGRKEYPHWPRAVNFYSELLPRLRALPAVRNAALALNHPLASGWTTQISVEGQPEPAAGQHDEVRVRSVTAGYFEALSIPLLRGRTIGEGDRQGAADVVVINEPMARKYFRHSDPIGKHISFWGKSKAIVGVVRGEHFGGLDRVAEPAMYPALAQLPMSSLTLVLRVDGDPLAYSKTVQEVVHSVDRGIALDDVGLVADRLDRSTSVPRFQTALITLFGGISLLLAAIGVYGLLAYQVQQRTHEIGVRVALGAQRWAITSLVVKRGLALAVTGVAIGMVGALILGRFVSAALFQVSTTDPAVFAAVGAILTTVAVAASYGPARRAARVDPVVALRYE